MNRRIQWTLAAMMLLPAQAVFGVTITLTGNNPTTVMVPGPCNGMGGPFAACGNTSYLTFSNTQATTEFFTRLDKFNTQPVGEENFASAFANWNATTGGAWTLSEQAPLNNITYTINTFNTFANTNGGGVQIAIRVATQDGYNGPPVGQLVWSQGLEINYTVAPNGGAQANPPINTLDNYNFNTNGTPSGGSNQFSNPCSAIPASPNNTTPSTIGATPAGTAYCDPIYPFQDGSQGFGDRPSGIYPIDSFRAEAFLSSVNTQTKTLTIYDGGVNYGFDLFVTPEPSTPLLIGTGLCLLVGVFRLRRTRS